MLENLALRSRLIKGCIYNASFFMLINRNPNSFLGTLGTVMACRCVLYIYVIY